MITIKNATFGFSLLLCMTSGIASDDVAYPEGYREWTHIKSQIATESHPRFNSIGGIHHIYANDIALKGYIEGSFPKGSVIVFDLKELAKKDGSLVEGKRRWIGVMEKDPARFQTTGGWGYENFSGNSKIDRNVPVNGSKTNCFSCHQSKASTDFVFSSLRD